MFAPSTTTGYSPNLFVISQDQKTNHYRDSPCPPIWMDSRLPAHKPSRRSRLYSPQSGPALQEHQRIDRPLQPHSRPLPRTQWSSIPSPRPQQYEDGPPEGRWASFPSAPTSAPSAQYYRPPTAHIDAYQMLQDSPDSGRRQRRKGFYGMFTRSTDEGRGRQVDVSRLYPPMNPYEQNRLSTHSAPDELEHRRLHYLSQSSVPGYMVLSSPSPHDDPIPMNLPRTPTYPPSGRRRMHSATGVGDAALADEAEFRLFVEATAGLGPEQAHREYPHPHQPAYSSRQSIQQEIRPVSRSHTTGELVSPLGETPTTMFALQQIAQMPEISARTQSEPRRQSVSDLDRWLHAPGTSMMMPDISPVEDVPEDDEELPDYAQSQAQAHERQRAEATKRAQELQRRWQQSGSRRGI